MLQLPRIGLLCETSTHYGRGFLRGVIRYSRLHGPWTLYIGAGSLEQGLPKVEFNGLIARPHSVRLARDIRRRGIPTIALESGTEELAEDNPLGEFNEVIADSVETAHKIAEHLIATGLESFAFCGLVNAPWSCIREQAFMNHLAARGFPCIVHRINIPNWMRNADWARAWTHEEPRLTTWLKSLRKPTGLMACNDMCGRQVLEACAVASVRVPADVAVVGVDNDELLCELSVPRLSSLALDVEKAGYEAGHLLDQMMRGQAGDKKLTIAVHPLWVVARRSSALFAKGDPLVDDALRFIEDHAGRGIGVPNIVSEVGISRRTLERKFLRTLNRSILTEIHLRRLDRAKNLLKETNLPVSRIAVSAGFANTRMLNRIFRNVEGLRPTTFRKKLQGDVTAAQMAARSERRTA